MTTRRSEITLGFVGSGKVEKRNAFALLRDLIDASGGNAKFIFPLTKTFWNPALEVVSAFAMDNGIPVEAIVDDTTAKVKELKMLLGGARRQHQSAAPAYKLASLLEEAKDGKLIVLWEDEDEDAMEAVRAAHEKGITLLELTRGLDRIELVTEADEEGEDEPISDEVPEDEAEDEAEEGVIVGQDEDDEDVVEPTEEEAETTEDETEDEAQEEEEFPEPEAEDDVEIDSDAGQEEDMGAEFPDEEEEFELPEEDESDVAVLDMEREIVEEVRKVSGMSEFQRRLLIVLENTSEAFVRAIDALLAEADIKPAAKPKALKPAIESKTAARKATAPIKKAAAVKKTAPPAKKAAAPARPAKAPVKRTVPAKKAAPAKAEGNGTGKMSKAQAQKIIDSYRPRRGRPPAEVSEARKILGLA